MSEKSIKSIERIRKEEELVSKLEASDIAFMVLEGHYFQGKNIIKTNYSSFVMKKCYMALLFSIIDTCTYQYTQTFFQIFLACIL